MAGGGALLRGIDRLVAEETGLPVHVADDPLSLKGRLGTVVAHPLTISRGIVRGVTGR